MAIRDDTIAYYARRAEEYERIYHREALRGEYARLQQWMRDALGGLDVLEIACGTGYWTQPLSGSARSVVAADASEKVLEIARAKTYARGNVRFLVADAFDLGRAALPGVPFHGALAGFWWSHIPLDRRHAFLASLHTQLAAGATVVMFDNHHVKGVSTPISRTDEAGNTYQTRRLDDGGIFEIVKNYPTREELAAVIEPFGTDVAYEQVKHFWFVRYTAK